MNYLKLILVTLFVMSSFGVSSQTRDGEEKLNLQYVGHHGTHSEYYPPADMPDVYFDDEELEIIIVGDGFADYYDVEIVSLGSMLTVISTQVDGYGDSIDVSSLSDGDYTIVITSEYNNVYQGYFAIE